jgi:hypothetical protein
MSADTAVGDAICGRPTRPRPCSRYRLTHLAAVFAVTLKLAAASFNVTPLFKHFLGYLLSTMYRQSGILVVVHSVSP